MTKLYTVESFSTYSGIKISENQTEKWVSLKEGSLDCEDIIFLDTKDIPKIYLRRLGMIRINVITNGVFIKDQNLLKISKAKNNSGGKIILTRAKKFKILKGYAEFIVTPKKDHDFTIIRISKNTTLELEVSITDSQKYKKTVNYRDLKI